MAKIRTAAQPLKCGETSTFEHGSPTLLINAYNPSTHPNSTFAMADRAGWFTWQGIVGHPEGGRWEVVGRMDIDLADYSDWHGELRDYNGDGIDECPGGQCGKLASVSLPGGLGQV